MATRSKGKAPMSEALYKKVCQPAFARIEESVRNCASKEDVNNLKEEMKELGIDLKEFIKSINVGNGKPSLREDIKGLQDDIELINLSHKKDMEGINAWRNWTLGIASAIVILLSSIAIYDWLDARVHVANAHAGVVTSGKP
ncbi:MAG TPA: hypothetical protein VIJ25_11890 [Methylococcales bacterium]